MRCKQGDLAIVTKTENNDIFHVLGSVVTCLRAAKYKDEDVWVVDMPNPFNDGRPVAFPDAHLTPIRPQSPFAEDEMLQILGLPNETVPAYVRRH